MEKDEIKAYIVFLIISAVIMWDLLKPGYILSLDLIFPPYMDFYDTIYGIEQFRPAGITTQLPLYLIVGILSKIVPSWFIEKVILFSIIFLAGISAYNLFPFKSSIPRFYAGLIYMINPYMYIRFLAGHWKILLAYALMPLAVKSFIGFIENPNKKRLILSLFAISLVSTANIHNFILLLLVLFIILVFRLPFIENKPKKAKYLIFLSILWILLNSYWIIPTITEEKLLVEKIMTTDLYVFTSIPTIYSALYTISTMHGFWREPVYTMPKDVLPFYNLIFFIILFLSVHGFISYYKDDKIGPYVKAITIAGIVGVILGSGIHSPFSSIIEYLYNKIFILKGFRDLHKFSALIALMYAYLGALGVYEFEKKYKKFTILFLFLPLFFGITMFNGFWDHINSVDYPEDWYKINEFLNEDDNEFNVLFLPWHGYMDFKWLNNKDKRLLNPSANFFDKPIIKGMNIEIGPIYTQSISPVQKYVEFLLKSKNNITNFGELVSIINVKYILLTKEADYENYFFLFNQSDLELVKETKNFYVFKNKHYRAKIFSTQAIACVNSWDELLEVSKREDITKRLYLIGNCSKRGEESYKAVEYEKINPAKYKINAKHLKYVVFTEEYSKDWKLGKQKPLKAYGVVNAFSEASASEIRYERFYKICLPSYVISLITFLACMGFLFYEKKALI